MVPQATGDTVVRVQITLNTGECFAYELRFGEGVYYRIGRDAQCEIAFPGADHLSRVHCTLSFENGCLMLSDNDSSNGTFLGGRRIRAESVQYNIPYRIGDCTLLVWPVTSSGLTPPPSPLQGVPLSALNTQTGESFYVPAAAAGYATQALPPSAEQSTVGKLAALEVQIIGEMMSRELAAQEISLARQSHREARPRHARGGLIGLLRSMVKRSGDRDTELWEADEPAADTVDREKGVT